MERYNIILDYDTQAVVLIDRIEDKQIELPITKHQFKCIEENFLTQNKPAKLADLEDPEQNELRPDLDDVPDPDECFADVLTPNEEFDPPGTEEGGGRR